MWVRQKKFTKWVKDETHRGRWSASRAGCGGRWPHRWCSEPPGWAPSGRKYQSSPYDGWRCATFALCAADRPQDHDGRCGSSSWTVTYLKKYLKRSKKSEFQNEKKENIGKHNRHTNLEQILKLSCSAPFFNRTTAISSFWTHSFLISNSISKYFLNQWYNINMKCEVYLPSWTHLSPSRDLPPTFAYNMCVSFSLFFFNNSRIAFMFLLHAVVLKIWWKMFFFC